MFVCHDLKKEIEPVSPPLPNSLRVIPVLFYAAVTGCAFFSAYFMIQKGAAEKAKLAQEQITAEEKKKIALVEAKHKALEADVNEAKSMIEWVRGSDVIQPLAMLINSSINTDFTSINKLTLSRRADNPWQIELDLKLNGSDTGIGQLEKTLSDLESAQFKKFSPRRATDESGLNYSATLIKVKDNNNTSI